MSPSTAPPRILHVNGHPGGEPQAFLAQVTRELLQAGIGQTVLHPAQDPEGAPVQPPLPAGVRVVELPEAGPGPLAFARHLPAALREELDRNAYTAVHLHGPLVGLVGGIAMASTAPGIALPVYYSPHTPLSAATLLQRLACTVACKPVASGHAEARDMQRLMHCEAFMLYPAVDGEFFRVEPQPDAEPLVVAMGHGRKDSGDGCFGDLAARFQFAGETVRFVWIGGCEPHVQERLEAAGVRVTGWLPDADVRALLGRARVYVQASRWCKTPRSLLQAMACSVPCVATDVPAHREVLRHGETGMLGCDVSDMAFQVKHLLEHADLCQHLGTAARRDAASRFALPRLRQSLLALYGLDGGHRAPQPAPAWQVA